MKKIAIIGAGGFGREVLTLINHINNINEQYEFIGFFDDAINSDVSINGYNVLGDINTLNYITEKLSVVVAVGNPNIKKKIIDRITNPLINFPTLIHPSVILGDENYITMGVGCIICAGTIVTTNIIIEDFVILNLSCTVGHDTIIKKYSSFMPSVNISGEVLINELVYVGTGAKIINQLEIGLGTIIGAGAVVAKSLPANCTAVGVPAKIIKNN